MKLAYHSSVTDQQHLVTILDIVHQMVLEKALDSLVDRLLSFGTLRRVLAQIVRESGLSGAFVELFQRTAFIFA